MRQVLWPNTPEAPDPAVEIRAWAAVLGGFEVETVLNAMQVEATDFAPTVLQLRERINPTPTYATVLDEFRRMKALGFSPLYTRAGEVPWSHPLIGACAAAGLWREWGQSPDATSDPSVVQAEAAFRAHFRESFKGVHARFAAGAIGVGGGRKELGDAEEVSLVRGTRALGGQREDGQENGARPGTGHARGDAVHDERA